MTTSSVKTMLKQYFGYTSFRPLQENIIRDILENKDVFVLMSTGGGKSLCYQLPSIIMKGTTIVISPLISLMKDQVDALVQNGIKAAFLNSSLLPHEQQQILEKLENNKLSLLYVAPERMMQEQFLSVLKKVEINFFAIDEAHCISHWGHDFRPEYRKLDIIRQYFPDKPLVALTATATPRVKRDIIERLQVRNVKTYQASFNRQNLIYQVMPKADTFSLVSEYIKSHPDESGIIYCQSRKTVENISERLQDLGIQALPYHAGLPDDVRRKNQESFIRENTNIIVATIAFGMGINKPNVRYIIHYDLPKTIEHYYQETGRAGRDGLQSECLLMFSFADKFFYEKFIEQAEDEEQRLIAKSQLNRMINFAQSKLCRRALLMQYFGEPYLEDNCNSCDNCLSPRETFDATVLAQKILSCVFRTGQRFGTTYVAQVLTGSNSQNILRNNHQHLSTYGIINDYSVFDIRTFISELLQLGYLQQTGDQYAVLKLTPKSTAILKGQEKVELTKPPKRIIKTEKPLKSEQIDYDKTLFNHLRTLRKKIADEQRLPPYIIFSDASLKDMSAYFPQTEEQFSQIYGVGKEKLRTYAKFFLREIIRYCKALSIAPVILNRKKKLK